MGIGVNWFGHIGRAGGCAGSGVRASLFCGRPGRGAQAGKRAQAASRFLRDGELAGLNSSASGTLTARCRSTNALRAVRQGGRGRKSGRGVFYFGVL
jgi:hypothetical protein